MFNKKICIIGLDDTPDDDQWYENMMTQLSENLISNNSEHQTPCSDHTFTLHTGNEWVRDICMRHGMYIQWITARVDTSATRIREMLRRGEDVSHWLVGEKKTQLTLP